MAGMTAAELNELRAFDAAAPIGDVRSDVQAGLICATLANVNRGKDTEPFNPIDFMPYAERPPAPEPILLDPEAQSRLIMSAVFGKHEDDL
ncbi:DUF4035 domain-containing protein [Sulfuriferula sp.]|uniref:phage tail assembly protein T n=1 Tax=Sulfuriferula sp. TaxID=2025307 RepID=UPI002730032A|nr:DUF4035 domain-containing protein [Sulfuriferula sp.]